MTVIPLCCCFGSLVKRPRSIDSLQYFLVASRGAEIVGQGRQSTTKLLLRLPRKCRSAVAGLMSRSPAKRDFSGVARGRRLALKDANL